MGPLGGLVTRGPHVKYYNSIDYGTDLGEAIFINSNLIFVDPGHVKLGRTLLFLKGGRGATEDRTCRHALLSKMYGIMWRQRN